MISTSEKPFLRIAFSITRSSGIGLATVSRAANDAPAPFASWTMSQLGSIEQDGDVDVAPRGVDEVVAADRGAVAVARDDDHVQVRAGHLDAGGERQRAP